MIVAGSEDFWWFLLCLVALIQTPGLGSQDDGILFPNPYFNQMFNCECDVTVEKCDALCCCDQDCPDHAWPECAQHPGDKGKIVTGNCSSDESPGDLDLLFCIHSHTSPFLGFYFDEIPHVDSISALNQLLQSLDHKPRAIGAGAEAIQTTMDQYPFFTAQNGYSYGSTIRTVLDASKAEYSELQLPANLLSGLECVPSPVRYLSDASSICVIRIDADVCASGRGTDLDYRMYLAEDGGLEQILQRSNYLKTAPLRVRYLRATQPSHQFLKVQSRPSRFRTRHPLNHDSGSGSSWRLTETLEPLHQKPPGVHFDPKTGLCSDVVVQVDYKLVWAASSILQVEADIIVANFSLPLQPESGSVELTQRFTISFVHKDANPESPKRSGNPGYLTGKPLIGMKGSGLDFGPIQFWSGSLSSMCNESKLEPVLFNTNVQSSCLVDMASFRNRSHIRHGIKSLFGRLLSSSGLMIAKGGSLNHLSMDEFVNVVLEEEEEEDEEGDEHQVTLPNHMLVEVLFTQTRNSISRICGVRVRFLKSVWSWTCPLGPAWRCRSPERLFPIKMSVNFIQIPLIWHHENSSRFWIQQDWGFCQGDQCWSELALPFNQIWTGDQRSYVAAWATFLLPAAVVYLLFIRQLW